jgi:putative sigma-54 modulation protein
MDYNIQFVGMPASDFIQDFVIEKLDKLGTKFPWLINADVFFKQEKGAKKNGKICEIRLSAPGPRIFAKADEAGYQLAINETIHELTVQLIKRRDEMRSH